MQRVPAGGPSGGQFTSGDAMREEAGQLALDFGDYVPERTPRPAKPKDTRKVVTDSDGVQHWPDGGEQPPLG